MLFVTTTAAMLALTASSATALGGIEVMDEDGFDSHCPVLSKGGCLIHVKGPMELTAHFLGFGIHEAGCTMEKIIKIDEDGAKEVYQMTNSSPGDANCATVAPACNLPWGGTAEATGSNSVTATYAGVCLNPAESDTNCTGDFQLEFDISNSNAITATTTASQNLGQCEVDFSGSIEHTNAAYEDIHIHIL
jgi:hypothetical protein